MTDDRKSLLAFATAIALVVIAFALSFAQGAEAVVFVLWLAAVALLTTAAVFLVLSIARRRVAKQTR